MDINKKTIALHLPNNRMDGSKNILTYGWELQVLTFQVTLKWINWYEPIDYTKVPLVLLKKLKWDTLYKTIVDNCAHDWLPHKVQLKWTHCQKYP